jgi:hypothetical protein
VQPLLLLQVLHIFHITPAAPLLAAVWGCVLHLFITATLTRLLLLMVGFPNWWCLCWP